MKTLLITAPGKLEWTEMEVPELKRDEVCVRVAYVGLCGTDIDIYKDEAHFEVKYPRIAGHEWSGTVERVGSDVTSFKPGDKVIGDALISCGKCLSCLAGYYTACKELKSIGTSAPYVDGAYKEYMITPERHLFKVPDGVSLLEACTVEPSVVAIYAVDVIKIEPGDIVLVSGTGAIGVVAAQYAKLKGAGIVILTGRNDKKLQIIKDTGIDYTINIKKEDMFKKIKEIIKDREVNVSVEASGNLEALEDLLKVTGKFGQITIPGSYHDPLKNLDLSNMASRDLSIRATGSTGGGATFYKVLWLMQLKKINTLKLITEIYDFDDIEKAINLHLGANDSIKTVIRVGGDT